MVDVRDAQAFQTYHIAGSLNLPDYTLKTKTFLKAKPLVLVNEGYHYRGLEALCQELRTAGFAQVAILDGGLNAWRQTVAPLAGDLIAQRRLNRIEPEAFFPERDYRHWAVLDVSSWPGSPATPGAGEDRQSRLRRFLTGQRQPLDVDASYLLIVSDAGEGYDEIENAVKDLGWINVFYLDGGKQAYQQYLKKQHALWNRTPGKQGAVKTCGGGR